MLVKVRNFLSHLSRIDVLISLFLFFLIIVTSRSLFRPEFFRVHDYVHGARIIELVNSAQNGHIPVRWTENFGYGYGMPLFEFYAPLPYYVGGLFYWITNNVVLSTKALFLIANVGSVLGSYLLGKQLYGRKGGVVVAAAYSLAPYRAVNLFVRGAVGESWGMMMMPWALLAGFKVVQNTDKKLTSPSWWYLTFSLVALFLSHNLSTLMYVPVSGLVLLIAILSLYRKDLHKAANKLFSLATSYLLAIGISAFYLFPALLEKDFTVIDSILSGYFHYSHHFLYIRQFLRPNWGYGGSAWGPDDGISFFLGYGQLFAVAISFVSILWFVFTLFQNKRSVLQFKNKVSSKIVKSFHFHLFFIFGVITAGALFATLLKSEWWWDTLPLISFIQFPWRWLSIAILFISLMAGYGMIIIQSRRMLGVIVLLLVGLLSLNIQYFRPESYLQRNEDFYYADQQLIRTEMSGILPDYIPKDLQLTVLDKQPTEDKQKETLPINKDGQTIFNQSALEKSEVIVNRPHQKLVSVTTDADSQVQFAVAWFPGWMAELNGEPIAVDKTDQGLVSVNVPPGQHTIGIYFGSTPVRWWSDTVSATSLLIVAFLLLPSTLFTKLKSKT